MKSRYTAGAIALALMIPAIFSAQTPDTFRITGCAKFWANDHPVKNVQMSVTLDYPGLTDPVFSGVADLNSSCSETAVTPLPLQPIPGFWIYGQKLDMVNDYLNGVSVGDMICIQRHILGLDPLPAYPLFAADVNKSGSVTGFDLLEIRKLLLGIYQEFSNSPSWRIWPPNCTFPNPANPFQPNCQAFAADSLAAFESHPVSLAALKIGDVNGDYDFDGNYQPANALGIRHFYLPDLALTAGETVDVPITRQTPFVADGFQFALRYDTDILQVLDVIPGENATQNDWAVFASEGLLKNVSLYIGYSIPNPIGIVRFLVKSSGKLSEAIKSDSTALQPLFYTGCGLAGKIDFGFKTASGVSSQSVASWVKPVSPNPFTEKTSIGINLARPANIRLEITDLAGRLTHSIAYDLPSGEHQLDIPASAVPPGNLAFYRLTMGTEIFAGKIIRL